MQAFHVSAALALLTPSSGIDASPARGQGGFRSSLKEKVKETAKQPVELART